LQNSEIVNNILVDPVEEDTELNINLDSNYIQHYFDIFVDEEIDTTVMCSAITSDKADEMYDEIGFECPDASTASTSTDSESGAYNNNDQEVCD
jgi:predicted AlkP superfamily pyrophosphatase or phosphodiesterase